MEKPAHKISDLHRCRIYLCSYIQAVEEINERREKYTGRNARGK